MLMTTQRTVVNYELEKIAVRMVRATTTEPLRVTPAADGPTLSARTVDAVTVTMVTMKKGTA